MKKLIAVAMAAAFVVPAMAYAEGEAASSSSSPKGAISLWGGYMTVGAGDVNDSLDGAYKDMKDNGGTGSVTKMSGGFQVGLEGTYAVVPNLGVGLRVGYLIPSEGSVNCKELSKDVVTISASGIPILVGGRYMQPVNDQVSVGGGLFLGYGMTSGTYTINYGSKPVDIDFDGSAFAGEVLLGVSYKVTPRVAVGLDLGYRMLTAPMAASSDVDVDGDGTIDTSKGDVKSGDKFKDQKDKTKELKLDLSGLIVAVSVGCLF